MEGGIRFRRLRNLGTTKVKTQIYVCIKDLQNSKEGKKEKKGRKEGKKERRKEIERN